MQLTLRDFFMRINLVRGVGQRTANACWRWLLIHPEIQIVDSTVVTQLADDLGLNDTVTAALQLDLFSRETNDTVTENLTHSGCLTIADAAYPEQLRETYAPPLALYFLGGLRRLKAPQL
ncbi:MAG TPA: DNA-protecting protein DprA, partial [Levilactobacillus hammesii]|nr:DNA-protecting protein DprA [Levilactobacillus hammesii]